VLQLHAEYNLLVRCHCRLYSHITLIKGLCCFLTGQGTRGAAVFCVSSCHELLHGVRMLRDMPTILPVAFRIWDAGLVGAPLHSGERSPCHWVSRAAQDAMTAANLQPVGDVDRTELLDAFEQRLAPACGRSCSARSRRMDGRT